MAADVSVSKNLPPDFRELEVFVETWALEGMDARHRKRLVSSHGERKAFYDAMVPRFNELVDYLDGRALEEISGADHVLMLLALALVDVSLSVEVFGLAHEEAHARWAENIKIACDLDSTERKGI